MAATTTGAFKAHLEAGGFGIAFYRDRAPKDAVLPFGVITEGIAQTPDGGGDLGDTDAERWVAELVQVSVYEQWRDAEGKAAESYTLPDGVWRRLEGARMTTPKPGTVKVTGRRRVPAVEGTSQDTGLLSAVNGVDGANVVANHFTCTFRRTA
jgi:hypothetical protein